MGYFFCQIGTDKKVFDRHLRRFDNRGDLKNLYAAVFERMACVFAKIVRQEVATPADHLQKRVVFANMVKTVLCLLVAVANDLILQKVLAEYGMHRVRHDRIKTNEHLFGGRLYEIDTEFRRGKGVLFV